MVELHSNIKEIIAGFTAGGVQVLVGQPFDLVKVRLQTSITASTTPWQVITSTLTKEGPLAFYKGTLAPFFGVGACVSVQFFAFMEAKRQILSRFGKNDQKDLTLGQFYLAGAVAGIVNTPITSPVEQVRIILQTQPSGEKRIFHGPRDAVMKIYKSHGFSGIFRGFNVTMLREAQAYGVWFLTYEFLIQTVMKTRGIVRRDISTPELMACGALAGDALWLASFPLDVIKSKLQSEYRFGKEQRFPNARAIAVDIWKNQGFKGFWRGIGPALIRAIPCSAATFTTFELTLRVLG